MTTVVRIAVSTSPDKALNVRKYVTGEPNENTLLRNGEEMDLTCYPGQNYQFDEVSVEVKQPPEEQPPEEKPVTNFNDDDDFLDGFYSEDAKTGEIFDPNADAPQSVQDGTADEEDE